MCLDIRKTTNPKSMQGIKATKDGKFLLGYKTVQKGDQTGKLYSRYRGYLWGRIDRNGELDEASQKLKYSSRETSALTKTETKRGLIDPGFHFFVHPQAAVADCYMDAGMVLTLHVPKDSFIAQGEWDMRKSFVATKAKPVSAKKVNRKK